MSVLPTTGPARRRILTPYVMIWLAIASFALAYLALLGLKPHMFASAGTSAADIEQKLAQTRRDMERGLADLDPLRRTVGEVKMDVANLKVAVAGGIRTATRSIMDEGGRARDRRAAMRPERTQRASSAAPSPRPPFLRRPSPTKKASTARRASRRPSVPAPRTCRARAQKSAKVINAQRTRPTPSRPAASSASPSPAAKPRAGRQAAAGRRHPRAGPVDRLAAAQLEHPHRPPCRRRAQSCIRATSSTARPTTAPTDWSWVRVASTAEAKNLCKVMETQRLPCEVSTYRGNAL